MKKKPIRFYYDFVSPYSYFAFSQLETIRQSTGRDIELQPVSVGRIMEIVGNVPTSLTCKAKRVHQGQDVARWAKKLGVQIQIHSKFGQFSTVPLVQAALGAKDEIEAFSAAAFSAVWREQAPLALEDEMRAFFSNKKESFGNYWSERAMQSDSLQRVVASAVDDGVFGVPHFVTEHGSFFGNDRLDFLYEALAS